MLELELEGVARLSTGRALQHQRWGTRGLVGASGLLGPEIAKARNGTLNNWVVYPILLVDLLAFLLVLLYSSSLV